MSQAPYQDKYLLAGRHQLSLDIGLLGNTASSVKNDIHGSRVSSDASGFMGSINYSYWLERHWALHLGIGVSDVDSKVTNDYTGSNTESAVVMPLLIGLKFRPFTIHHRDQLRPFVAADVGSWFGITSNTRSGLSNTQESYVETALGGRLGIGMDLSLGRTFVLGWQAGYQVVSDFERRIGSEKNYSGPDLLLSIGVLLGRGK